MSTFVERLQIIIDANSAGAVKGLGQTTDAALGAEASTSKFAKALPYVAIGAVAVGAGILHAVNAYDEAHKSVLQLDNSIKNNTQLAGANRQKFLDLADALQQKTAADGDQIVSAEAMLGTFRLTQDQILALTPLIVDYARKFDTDLVTAAKQVGKAMDGSVGALKRNGVTIDEQRFKTDRYGAVVEALRGQVGGFAEQEGKTFSGRLETLKNNLGDVEEAIGQGLVPMLSDLVSGLNDAIGVAQDATEPFGGLATVFEQYYKFIALGPLGPIAAGIEEALPLVGGMSDIIGETLDKLPPKQRAAAEAAREGTSAAERQKQAAAEVNAELERQQAALTAATTAVFAKMSADLAAEGSMLGVESAANSYTDSLAKNGAGALETRQALNQYETAIVSAATAAGKAAEAALGPQASAQEKSAANTKAQIETLSYLAATASPAAAAAIQAYIDKLKSTPEYWATTIVHNAADALARLQPYINAINALPSEKRTLFDAQIASIGGIRAHAAGGVFSTPHMGVVAEAGPEAIIPLSNPARAAQVMAEAGLLGGSRGGGTTVNVVVNAPVGADAASIGRELQQYLDVYARRIGRN